VLRLSVRHSLRESSNVDIKALWKETSAASNNIIRDSTLVNTRSLDGATKALKLQAVNQSLGHVKTLTIQGMAISSIVDSMKPSQIAAWTTEVNKLPATLFNFTRKALQQQLPTKANLHRWGKTTTPACPLCNMIQTNKHVLNNCSSKSALDRYKVRHDAVLRIVCTWLQGVLATGTVLHADLSGADYKPLDVLFQNLRPDIAVVHNNAIYLLELTVCNETNMIKSRDYKLGNYLAIGKDCTVGYRSHSVHLFTMEVSSLGLVSDVAGFTRATTVNADVLPKLIVSEIVKCVVGNSYNVYRIEKRWTNCRKLTVLHCVY